MKGGEPRAAFPDGEPPPEFQGPRHTARTAGLDLTARLTTPSGALALLVLATLALRLVFAAALGLGIDESYMVAAGRHWQLSYFDHPPLAWWLAWGAARLFGSDAAFVVRLPFVLLFALSTLLMYRLTDALFGARAGLWAAALLNAAPVLGATSASWVLPDGPLIAALLAAAFCLVRGLRAAGRAAWGWWLATGAFAGLALLSKYSAALTILGALVFLATEPASRSWLKRPHPYAAGLAAFVLFAPVLIWNARHGWISLTFQAGRAGGRFHPFGPAAALGGAALYFLPWIWLALVWCGLGALWRGPADPKRWLMLCLAAPPIVFFTAVALWSKILFHWSAPGYLMLIPLLGEALARREPVPPALRRAAIATGLIVVFGTGLAAAAVRLDWFGAAFAKWPPGGDPTLALIDWTSLREELGRRGFLARPGLVVAATRWHEAGKIDYALKGRLPVLCLGADPRQYGIIAPISRYSGADVLIIAAHTPPAIVSAQFGDYFDRIDTLPPADVLHRGRAALRLQLYLGHDLHPTAPAASR
jgi:4-amino-4-deoxy-L-arabinose transferase-like glycosyltransferase